MAEASRLRVAVFWPKPRRDRWRLSLTNPQYPDLSDGLVFLEHHGVDVSIEETQAFPFNPLINMHEFYSGLDPVRALRVASRISRYDVIICVGDATAFFLILLKRLFRLNVRILLIDPAISPGYAKRKRLQDFVIPRADHVIVYGQVQLDYLEREYRLGARASFMLHRADTRFYCPPDVSLNRTDGYVYSVGLDVSRDFETLAAAARQCADAGHANCRFRLQTTRPVTNPAPLVIENVPISYAELRARYANATVVVLPLHDSLHAGGINTLLEAMAMGKAVVVSASKGIADYVIDRQTARVVAPGDVSGMSRAIIELLASPSERKALGENARGFVVRHCDNAVYAARLADTLRGVSG